MSDDLEDLCHEELAHTDGPVTRKLKQQAQRIEQLEERVEELESFQECACAYDTPTDICAFHKRLFDRITTVRRDRIEKLEAALREIADGQRDADKSYAELFVEVCMEARKALEGEKDD